MFGPDFVCYRIGMIRSLPIILLALGLIFAFASLSRAATPSAVFEQLEHICVETSDAELAAPSPKQNGVMCWKKMKSGLLTTSCTPEPLFLASMTETNPQEFQTSCLEQTSFKLGDIEPLLHLPPPRR